MTAAELHSEIVARLPFTPNRVQAELLSRLSSFVSGESGKSVFILNGYAGTGKTSIGGALIRALSSLKMKTILLAPTGRAAKVAAGMVGAGGKSSTIHRRIYHQDPNSPDGRIVISPNRDSNSLFIIDEASLIADSPSDSNSLLVHLLRHVNSRTENRLLFIGDTAQLPPVGQTESMAMKADRFSRLGLNTETFTLDLPERQAVGSGILTNANNFRYQLGSQNPQDLIPIRASGFPDVTVISSNELADELSTSWSKVGIEETIIITRSNKRANNFNTAIRNLVMMAEEPLQSGDRLVISKNDYYWSRINNLKNFLANGETAIVTHVGRPEKMYGRYFTEVDLHIPTEDVDISAKLMMRSLVAEGPSISQEEMRRLNEIALSRQDGDADQRMKRLLDDPYVNALQAKYAYCVTCHKAQGGQWKHVYIDMGAIPPDAIGPDFWRWLYTAVTRATEKLYFINPCLPVI